jgi:hypothetical protein
MENLSRELFEWLFLEDTFSREFFLRELLPDTIFSLIVIQERACLILYKYCFSVRHRRRKLKIKGMGSLWTILMLRRPRALMLMLLESKLVL